MAALMNVVPHGLTARQYADRHARWAVRRDKFGPTGMSPEALAHMRTVPQKALRVRLMLQRNRRHCGRGHLWTEANTRWSTVDPRNGKRRRYCRACDTLAVIQARERARERRSLRELRAAMVAAHPDKGGTSAKFIKASRKFRRVFRAYEAQG